MKNRLITSLLMLGLSGLFTIETSAQNTRFEQKSCFSHEYPRYISFRGENGKTAQNDYNVWKENLSGKSGLIRKFIPEEVPVGHKTPGFARKYANENPEKLMMLHLNGEARQFCGFEDVRNRYFPGHWAYMEGSMMIGKCKAGDNTVKVGNIRPFLNKGYVVRKAGGNEYLPLMVLLVPLDEKDNRLWYESEIAEISSVDKENKTIDLVRGVYGTEALDFESGRTYIAPIAGGLWGKHVMFFYNLSSVCPRDKDGMQANDVYAEEIAGWFSKGGCLENFDGIAFDVNYFEISDRGSKWDVNNDGKADGGWINGRNVWKEGDMHFFTELRKKIGDDFIISADGQHYDNQQLPTILNGIESEGLIQHNDMWRGFSRALNTHTYWMANNMTKYDFRYVVMKLMGQDVKNPIVSRRFGSSVAFCLDAAITIPVGDDKKNNPGFEFIPEKYREEGSLGKIQGPLLRYYESQKPISEISGSELQIKAGSDVCNVVRAKKSVTLDLNDFKSSEFMIENIELPEGDVIIEVDAVLDAYPSALEAKYMTPAIMWLKPVNLPKYDKSKLYNGYFTDLYGFFGEKGHKLTYYFRNMTSGIQNLELKVRDAAKISIRSLKVYNAPDVVMREFENALIIANPSLDAFEMNPHDYVSSAPCRKITIPSVDAVYIDLKK